LNADRADSADETDFVKNNSVNPLNLPDPRSDQISNKGNTIAVGDNVGAGLVPAQ
jgi:hypothetical protein